MERQERQAQRDELRVQRDEVITKQQHTLQLQRIGAAVSSLPSPLRGEQQQQQRDSTAKMSESSSSKGDDENAEAADDAAAAFAAATATTDWGMGAMGADTGVKTWGDVERAERAARQRERRERMADRDRDKGLAEDLVGLTSAEKAKVGRCRLTPA